MILGGESLILLSSGQEITVAAAISAGLLQVAQDYFRPALFFAFETAGETPGAWKISKAFYDQVAEPAKMIESKFAKQCASARAEQLAKLDNDLAVVDRIAARLAKGKRVELHIDVHDVRVLVKYARAAIDGHKRILSRVDDNKPE